MTPAGKFDSLARIEQKLVARDGVGGEVVTWIEFATRLAAVAPLRGREVFAAG